MTEVPDGPLGESVALLRLGDFGDHVAALLCDNARWPQAMADSVADAFEKDSRAFIAAMWRPCPAVCEEADALAFRHQRPWLPVVMDHPHVRVGPVVVPGQGACFACFTARYDQHDSQRDITAALRAGFDREPDFGPRGYLDHHARLAAALAQIALGDLSEDWLASAAAQVLTFNVYRNAIRRHTVIARSGCPRCGRPADAANGSAMADLLHNIAAERAARHARGRRAELRETADDR
jgi:bacteriocin biosynthesis cyclodehydratase domain-containing protein